MIFKKNTNSNIDLTLNNQYQGLRKDISNINTKINVFESQNDFIKNKTNIFPDIKKMIEDKFIILTDKIKSDLYDIEEKQIILITKKIENSFTKQNSISNQIPQSGDIV